MLEPAWRENLVTISPLDSRDRPESQTAKTLLLGNCSISGTYPIPYILTKNSTNHRILLQDPLRSKTGLKHAQNDQLPLGK